MEVLLTQTIQPQHAEELLNQSNGTTQMIRDWMNEAAEECKNIGRHLLRKDLQITNKNELKQLVQRYQARIRYLMDTLQAYKKSTPNYSLHNLYDCVIKELEELIVLIQQHYPEYFNMSDKIPAHDWQQCLPTLRQQVRLIKQHFTSAIDNSLLQILMIPLCQFIGYRPAAKPSYSELEYMKALIKKLVFFRLSPTDKPNTERIMQLLLEYNFNTSEFITYYTHHLLVKTDALASETQKFHFLAFCRKELLQLQKRPCLALLPEMPSVQEQLVDWVNQEIDFLDKQQYRTGVQQYRTGVPCFPPAPIPPTGLFTKNRELEKFKTSFSVAELALFIRCLQESKLIEFKDRRTFIKIISQHFTTVGTEKKGISWASMDSKYSAIEQDTIKMLRKKIRDINDFLRGLESSLS